MHVCIDCYHGFPLDMSFNRLCVQSCSMWWLCWRAQFQFHLEEPSSQQLMVNWYLLVALTVMWTTNWVLQLQQFLSQSCRCPSHGSSSNFLMPRQAISTSNFQEDDHCHLHISYHCILAVYLGPSKPRICTVFACFTPVLDHVNKSLLF